MPEVEDPAEASEGLKPGAISALLAEMTQAPIPPSEWDDAVAPGATIGRFEIVREIGRGGFGVVYEARDLELGRSVALKAVRPLPGIHDESALAEAETAARLAHPNIIQLHDIGRSARAPIWCSSSSGARACASGSSAARCFPARRCASPSMLRAVSPTRTRPASSIEIYHPTTCFSAPTDR